MTREGRRPRCGEMARGVFISLACILAAPGPAMAGGPPMRLDLRISPGAVIGGRPTYTAIIARLPKAAQEVVLYAGTLQHAVPLANQTCVRAASDSWECSFILAPNERGARGATHVFARSYRRSALGGPDAASPAVPVGTRARSALPQLLLLAGLGAVALAAAGFRIIRRHGASF